MPSTALQCHRKSCSRAAHLAQIGVTAEELHSEFTGFQGVFLVVQQSKGIAEGLDERQGASVDAHDCHRIVGIFDQLPQNVSVDLVLELLRKFLQSTAGASLASAAVAVGLSLC